MEKTSKKDILFNGLFKENPIFVMILGMCPALAVTKTFESALGMGLALIFVLFFSNLVISLIKKIVPKEIRIPVYIVIIASLVTIVQLQMNLYLPSISEKLGVFVALIVVNCIILGRAESFASKNTPLDSIIDAIGIGLGFTLALCILATIRELLGSGTITIWSSASLDTARTMRDSARSFFTLDGGIKFDFNGIYEALHIKPASFFISGAGSFVVLSLVIVFANVIRNKKEERKTGGTA